MDKKTFTLNGVTFSYIDNMPDGDYTVGRGADPRGKQPVVAHQPTREKRETGAHETSAKPTSASTDKAAAGLGRRTTVSSPK
jgi:hypothetical protein